LLFVGGAGDFSYVNDVIAPFAGNDRVIALAGKTSLGELLGVMTHCDLFITNDSGPLHLAASLGIPTVSFFGPETPVLYGPRGGDALIFHEELYCSPCLNVFNVKTAPCAGENSCLQAISVDAVFDGIRNRFAGLWKQYGKKNATTSR
jgi:ADP-heptose:LPS heptosyltransferase